MLRGVEMSKLIVEGGRRLYGEINLQGSKNSSLPILAATLLIKGKTVLHNCPNLSDVRAAIKILEGLGCQCNFNNNTVVIDASNIVCSCIPVELMREMRSSVVFLGAILSRCSAATISAPGGCELGPRPIDLHLKAISMMGYSVKESGGYIVCKRKKFQYFTDISLDFPSVGATENIILASVLSKGSVVLHHAAREPEIVDLAAFINSAGGKIIGAGTDTIEIIGVETLRDVEHTVIPDRIAAATYMSAAAVTGGDIIINNVECSHITSIINAYSEMGCNIDVKENSLHICSPYQLKRIKTTRSTVYPGFPTDSGPLLVASLIKADGTSVFVENIFENRFNYISELKLLGADIKVFGKVALVEGVQKLYGANLVCTDLRGGAAVLVAALAADGESTIDKICHIERGYEEIEKVLNSLSAKIIKD